MNKNARKGSKENGDKIRNERREKGSKEEKE